MKARNNTIDYVKGFAIISVICAHCNAVLDTSNQFAVISSLFLQNIGTLGVICFFVISGVLFHHPGKDVGQFFKKKIRNIIIPWLVSATCIYLYVHLRRPPVTLLGWLNFVLGNGSYCYYLTILMALYVIFTFVPFMRKNAVLLVCEGVTIISTVWFYNISGVNPYLNILNWIGYFSLGVQIAENPTVWSRLKKRVYIHIPFEIIISCGTYAFILIIQLYNKNGGGYWNNLNVIACWIGAITLVLISIILERGTNNILKKVVYQAGINSFGIYIWHMPLAGIVARVFQYDVFLNFVVIRPVVILIIMLLSIRLIRMIVPLKLQHYVGI